MVKTESIEAELNIGDISKINYKDTKKLSVFLNDQGKILPRRVTGITSKEQKRITKLIKRARIAALLPFVIGKL